MNQICPVCKASYPPEVKFCINDGTQLGVPVQNPFEQQPKANNSFEQQPKAHNPFEPQPNRHNPFEQQNTVNNPFESRLPLNQPYPKASLGNRFLAFLIDGLIFVALLIPSAALLIFAFIAAYGNDQSLTIILGVSGTILFLLPIAYQLFKDGMGIGQSYGKRAMQLIVIDLDTNTPCSKSKSLARNIVSALLGFFPIIGQFIEPIMVLATEDGRKLGDRAANTMVIDKNNYPI